MTYMLILSDEKYWMVSDAWSADSPARDGQQLLVGPLVVTPSVCQMPRGRSLELDL